MTNSEQILAGHRAIKQKYPAAIVLIKVGNIYQAFDNDAQLLHKILHLSLRNSETTNVATDKVEFPITALESHLAKLLKGGFKVAVCSYHCTMSIA